MYFNQKRIEDAVSPVVGVILMVAVTVILAAVIGSFVLDLGNNVQANPQAGVSFDQTAVDGNAGDGTNDAEVTVQVVSMENADTVLVDGGDADRADAGGVGSTVDVADLDAGDQITVIGVLDGKEAVLQTYTAK